MSPKVRGTSNFVAEGGCINGDNSYVITTKNNLFSILAVISQKFNE